jgi:ketosteroid isomerase-like protein
LAQIKTSLYLKPTVTAGNMFASDEPTVRFANEAFYTAFLSRDLAAMDEVWSRRSTVTCVHPGWAPLIGRDRVMGSWQAILGNPQSPRIHCRDARVVLLGDIAYVVCYEELDKATFLVATNVFAREDGTWKLVHHQAGAVPPPEEAESEPADVPIQ